MPILEFGADAAAILQAALQQLTATAVAASSEGLQERLVTRLGAVLEPAYSSHVVQLREYFEDRFGESPLPN
jgi:hypothetical protein